MSGDHDQFLLSVSSRLSSLISSDPWLSKLSPPLSFSHPSTSRELEHTRSISIQVRRFDHSYLDLHLSEQARVFQLRRCIQEKFSSKIIHWKSIWKRYSLITSDQQHLLHPNRSIRSYGISDNAQLAFVRRRRLK